MHRTAKIYLSPLSAADSETLFGWINERDLVIFNSGYKPVHKPNHEAWFEGIVKKTDLFIFGVRRIEDDKLIGSCQLNNLNYVSRTAELQIRIATDEDRGKGFGSDAVQLLLKFAFDDLNLNKVYLNVFSTNARAIKAYQKAGFRQECELRQHAFVDGKYLNIIVMAVLREDYEKQDHRGDSSA